MARARIAIALMVLAGLAGCADQADNQLLLNANRNHIATEVVVSGSVTALLADNSGPDGNHQRFMFQVDGLTLEVDHNIGLAQRVPLTVGERLLIKGQYEPDPGHPVIHYTHHATDRHQGGYIQAGDTTFQ